MVLLVLLLVLIVVPAVEIVLIIRIGEALGLVPTVLLLVGDAILGSIIMRAQGRAAWRRFSLALSEGRIPAREVIDGGLVMVGGALLVAPGFLTDILGVLFLAPPTRALIRRTIARRLAGGVLGRAGRMAGRRTRPGPASDYDLEGHAVEIVADQRPLPPATADRTAGGDRR